MRGAIKRKREREEWLQNKVCIDDLCNAREQPSEITSNSNLNSIRTPIQGGYSTYWKENKITFFPPRFTRFTLVLFKTEQFFFLLLLHYSPSAFIMKWVKSNFAWWIWQFFRANLSCQDKALADLPDGVCVTKMCLQSNKCRTPLELDLNVCTTSYYQSNYSYVVWVRPRFDVHWIITQVSRTNRKWHCFRIGVILKIRLGTPCDLSCVNPCIHSMEMSLGQYPPGILFQEGGGGLSK